MKDNIAAFTLLEAHGFSKDDAKAFLIAIENDETQNATKGDLKDLEIRLLKEIGSVKGEIAGIHRSINEMTWKFLGALVTIGALFKGLDILMTHWVAR